MLVCSPEDSRKLKRGEILVAPETTPEFTPAILKASAIVTDFGGVLSHPAIVAREMGIPGVVGTREATKLLVEASSDILVQIEKVKEEIKEAASRHVRLVRPLVEKLQENEAKDKIAEIYLEAIYQTPPS